MTQLTRWDPLREMLTWRSAMDRMFEESIPRPFGLGPEGYGLAMDVIEKEDTFLVETAIPGIDPKDLDISVSENVLTIKGETKSDEGADEQQYHIRERRYGNFCRSVSFPSQIDAEDVEASYENGILKLNIPKAEVAKPRKISIRSDKMIEGESSTVG